MLYRITGGAAGSARWRRRGRGRGSGGSSGGASEPGPPGHFPGIRPLRAVWPSSYSNSAGGKGRGSAAFRSPRASLPPRGRRFAARRARARHSPRHCRDELCVRAPCLEMLRYRLLLVWICPDLMSAWLFSFTNAYFCCKRHAFRFLTGLVVCLAA